MKASEITRNSKGQFVKGAPSNRKTHGLAGTKFYKTYYGIMRRCTMPHDTRWSSYGGKGIKNLWESFEEFYQDMYTSYLDHSKRYGGIQTTLDRVDSNGNYCKENCRWANQKTQQRNRSNNKLITFNGKTLTSVEWGELLGISAFQIRKRLYRGWSVESALSTPILGVGKYKRKYHESK